MEPITLILISVVALLCGFHFLSKAHSRKSRGRPGQGKRRQPDPLISACLGDRAKAVRLASYERRRDPRITDAEARVRALDHLISDRS